MSKYIQYTLKSEFSFKDWVKRNVKAYRMKIPSANSQKEPAVERKGENIKHKKEKCR